MAAMLGTMIAGGALAAPFENLKWEKRLLLVFSQGDDNRASIQERQFAGGGAVERDLLVVDVPPEGKVRAQGVEAVEAKIVRRAYVVSDDAPFTVILVGKDGGVKLRSSEPIDGRDLFATIDAMPMRANEMRRN